MMYTDFLSTCLFLISIVFFICSKIFKQSKWYTIGKYTGLLGVIFGFFHLGYRWVQALNNNIEYLPLTTLYDTLIFVSCIIPLIYLIAKKKYQFSLLLDIFVFFFAFLISFLTNWFVNQNLQPSPPVLKSIWLFIHAITSLLSYAFFGIAFIISILFLLQHYFQKQNSNKLHFDNLIYKFISIGFLWLTIGIITGAIWADIAWGSYWNWDPKEVWSLITWFVYSGIIHLYIMKGLRGPKLARLTILGFLFVLFTYLGVTLLLPSLHSYTK